MINPRLTLYYNASTGYLVTHFCDINAKFLSLQFLLGNATAETNDITAETNDITAETNDITAETNDMTAETNDMTAETNDVTAETNP